MQVAIINQQGHNFGDEAAGAALVYQILSSSKVEKINVLYASDSPLPVTDKRVAHWPELSLRKVGIFALVKFFLYPGNKMNLKSEALSQWIKIISQSDRVFVSPCGASIGIYKDWKYLLRIFIVIKCKKTPIFHFNTIGKSNNLLFDFIALTILKRSIVNVRERKSLQYVERIGIDAGYGPDTAFLLNPLSSKDDGFPYIAFVPTHLDDWHPYFTKHKIDHYIEETFVKEIVDFLLIHHLFIKIIPHFNTENEVNYCTRIYNFMIHAGLPQQQITICQNVKDYKVYDNEIASSAMVVGMRYHAIVLAAKNSTPFVALSYENKMIEVCRYTDTLDYAIDLANVHELEPNTLLNKMNTVFKNRATIHNHLMAKYGVLNKAAGKLVQKFIFDSWHEQDGS